jgi:hypothetical protein
LPIFTNPSETFPSLNWVSAKYKTPTATNAAMIILIDGLAAVPDCGWARFGVSSAPAGRAQVCGLVLVHALA